jgi:hypothetical protein
MHPFGPYLPLATATELQRYFFNQIFSAISSTCSPESFSGSWPFLQIAIFSSNSQILSTGKEKVSLGSLILNFVWNWH